MKNILFIVLDSITNDQLFNCINSKDKAPFLNKLRDKAITGDNMYSQAPSTEAALMSLLGSVDTLDAGGYMEKFKNKNTVIDEFRNNGYKTFFPTYYPSIYPSYMYYGASEISYIEKFTFSHLWDYRFKHFKKLYLSNETTDKENIMLEDMLEDNLKAWVELIKLLNENSPKTSMMNNCINRNDLEKTMQQVLAELSKFKKDKKSYLNKLFLDAENHILFKINPHNYIDKINNDDFRNWFIDNYTKTFKLINKKQIKSNLRNAKLPLSKIARNLKDTACIKGLLAGYKNLIFDKDITDRISFNFDLFKQQRSFRTVADLTLKWIENNKNSGTPWMAYVHVDDAHYPENFFTYDTDNKKIVEKEFEKINHFLDNLPKGYCGTIASDLSLLYCDSIIEMMFEYLEKNRLLENTSIVITADHGFSYYFNPIREKYVISSYKENYNVPFIVYDKQLKHKTIKGYLATKDIPATLLDLANIKIPTYFKGKSLLNFEGRDFATVEYMGGGCPDLKRRPIILGIRNKNYEVIVEAFNNQFDIKEVYDIKEDLYEQKNLYKNRHLNLKNELEFIQKRYDEIISDSKGE